MEALDQILRLQVLNDFWLTIFMVIPMVLISRTVVAGTRYSPILIIVIFGLAMGYVLVASGVATPGLVEFPVVDLISKVTLVALIVSFFVGGQELRKILGKISLEKDDMVIASQQELVLGTNSTQLFYLIRTFFLLLGIEGLNRIILGAGAADVLANSYPLIAYIGLVGAIILIDPKATVKNKPLYIRKGLYEIGAILLVLFISFNIAQLVKPVIALPQIFFAMILSAAFGAVLYKWFAGPTVRALLFAGIPVVLAANFMIGGSRIAEAFKLTGMNAVMAYGFFGQLFWMFGGLALLIFFGAANHVRNLAPGMAGALSHSGLTGACTAGDLGEKAAMRAPIMINIPFFGHVFVFSVLAISAQREQLLVSWALLIAAIGLLLTIQSLRTLRNAAGEDSKEVKGLMQFSMGWQLIAVFGGLLLLNISDLPMNYAAMAQSSAISHFGLFAAIQGGMFGETAAELIPFIFAMPFLVHPLVFGMFGKAMEREGRMLEKVVYFLAITGLIGIIYAIMFV
ncbi:MAG: hypothetical protein SCK28_04940 [Bacillota bacterium]|nr:hypothetical protein [Bacillota bacterium]